MMEKSTHESKDRQMEMQLDTEDVDTQCRYTQSCRPAWLQRFANAKAFLIVVTAYAFVQGTSKTVLPVGYLSGKAHQPRILSVSLLIIGTGLFVMSMAHFTSPIYDPQSDAGSSTCSTDGNVTTCQEGENTTHLKYYIVWLLVGQFLNGVAGGTLWVLGVTFLEMSTHAKNVALYVAIMAAGSGFGPSLGYVVGGNLLEIYVDHPRKPPFEMDVSDPAWVGAWWIANVASSILCFILAIFMFLFPRELPETAEIRKSKVSEAHNDGTAAVIDDPEFGLALKDIPKATWLLIRNPAYMFICMVDALEFMVIIGVSTFLPKFIQNQFGQTVSWSPILAGLMGVPASFVGQIISGAIAKKFNWNVTQLLKFTLFCTIASVITAPVYLAKCSGSPLAGVTTPYNKSDGLLGVDLVSACNMDCQCSTSLYEPVCGPDGVQYFSPCHAGCSGPGLLSNSTDHEKEYSNCACVSQTPSNRSAVVLSGQCDSECNLLYYVFVPIGVIHFFFVFLNNTPVTVATLRVVPDKLRTYGMGVNQVFLRLLGSIPAPLIFGAIVDDSCTVWEEKCDTRGSCWVYDNLGMSYRMFILVLCIKALSIICIGLTIVTYKPPSDEEDKSNEQAQRGYSNAIIE